MLNLNNAQTLCAGVHERHHGDRPSVARGLGPALLRKDDAQVSLKSSQYHIINLLINYRSTRKRVNTNASGNEVKAALGAVMHSILEVLN